MVSRKLGLMNGLEGLRAFQLNSSGALRAGFIILIKRARCSMEY